MGVFEHFPYVNYHELNLSWILRKLKELEDVIGTQIVDLVARAGVAENAQAIADLTETVETVETTATSAGAAASAAQASANAAQTTANSAASAASAAQTSANTANAGIATINTKIARTSGQVPAIVGTGEVDWFKFGNVVTLKLIINSVTTTSADIVIATIPESCRPTVDYDFLETLGDRRIFITAAGEIKLQNAVTNVNLRGSETYVI